VAENEPSRFLAVARIIKPQGRRGEVIAELTSDFPDRFSTLRSVYLQTREEAPSPALLENVWKHKGRIVLKFAGIDSIDAALCLRNRYVLIPFEERVQLPEDSYYHSELVGCRVLLSSDQTAGKLGIVTSVEPTGGVPVLHVARDVSGKNELLIPFARAICKRIDPEARVIEIDPPEDLLTLNDDHV
jgi:16S rRNA processing protein RimM